MAGGGLHAALLTEGAGADARDAQNTRDGAEHAQR